MDEKGLELWPSGGRAGEGDAGSKTRKRSAGRSNGKQQEFSAKMVCSEDSWGPGSEMFRL